MNNEYAFLSESKTEKDRGLNYGRKLAYVRWCGPATSLILGSPFPSSPGVSRAGSALESVQHICSATVAHKHCCSSFPSCNNFYYPQLSHPKDTLPPQVLCTMLETGGWRRTEMTTF